MANPMGFKTKYVAVKLYRYKELPELTRDLEYETSDGRLFIVPKGFKTNFASVPRILWWLIAPVGKHTLPSVLHDYLYEYGHILGVSRKEADKIFWDANEESNVARITNNVMWFCVRVFARKHYKKG